MSVVSKIGFVSYDTKDIGRLSNYYEQILGYRIRRDGNLHYCHGMSGEASVVLRPVDEAGGVTVGLQLCDGESWERLKGRLKKVGIDFVEGPCPEFRIDSAIRLKNVHGINIIAYRHSWVPLEALRTSNAILPTKLGHAAFNVRDPQACVSFFVNVLGFKVSDWMGDFFAFLRCNADHHSINFLRGDRIKIHHAAFELRDWSHIQVACDHLARSGVKLIWGPGRHGIGHNIFTYHYDPDGNIIELFTELDRMLTDSLGYFDPQPWHSDNPQKPRVWTPEEASNLWGDPAPPDFRK